MAFSAARILGKLKRIQAIQYEKQLFDLSVIPQHTDFLGIYYNNCRIDDLLRGARFFQFDPVLGHRYRKNSAVLFLRQNQDRVEKYLCLTDQNGFVPNSLNFVSTKQRLLEASQTGRKSIFLMGGSTVAHCSGYLPDAEIATHLERKLEQLYPGKYIVINAGIGGYASDNQLKYLMYEILPLQPHIVIFYDGWNDCSYLNGLLTAHKENYIRGSVRQSYCSQKLYENSMSVTKMLGQASRLALRILAEKVDRLNLLSKLIPSIAQHPLGAIITSHTYNPISLEIYANNIYMAHSLCQAYGTKFLHFLQPLLLTGNKSLSKTEEVYFNSIPDYEVAVFKQFYNAFESRHFHDPDLFQRVHSNSLRNIFDHESETIFKDTGHIESFGNDIVATYIANYLSKAA